MLRLENFSRYYGYKKVIKNIELEIKENEILCILGPNGAGKTTLLEGMLSHYRQENSKLFFLGKEIKTLREHYEYLQYVSYLGHEPGLFLDLTLEENIQFFLDLYKYKKKVLSYTEIEGLLHKLYLYDRKNDFIKNFSRGMKQRAGILRCFLSKPKLLLLDEPLTGLDENSKLFLLELLSEFKKTGSCIVVTHDSIFFKKIVDRSIYLNAGIIEKIF